ncbi:T7SS effector LXG polymorphic toxin [Bacillus licheniformis]|uniref:T7SS effector LXG polymorphic toxin n=1 Tax=Bacillus licheniformis TaxID=1402 RepID=UPI002280363A|nr:T7SS effector LXG polymorphic toxin [Bacillus licheniformis]MCY7956636.1 T7SS effector LXG polymorphic toxin [Bacillus licheniformis]MCY8157788.1 T7SS effector LXG polymorphic toxin [Bacillus licheniformis]MCY8528960.1 T7SS effector LXG polymorphic toxin [Bacillus licheniformis]MCY8743459.1 T7SS effector LXG polymorphic toxin [Bacillus licheniformis]MCY9299633.1 T7SS effector LXG polymorphic toxin [Bacillus licheniformis]
MKTLDVHALHHAIDQTLEQLKQQSDELSKVKKAVESITSLDDALKGKGGDAIRAFYEECHTPFLQFYDTFIEEYSSTLKKMKSALNSLEPNHNGFISQSFLEHELEQGLNAADRTTKRLVSKTNATIAKVSHIVDLPDLNDSGFHEQNQKALKEINQTIEKLHAFDREQTSALKTAENDLETMQRYISRLEKMYTGPKIEITGYQKGSILKPDEMDALRGGQDTAMGVMLDKLDKRSKLEKEASKIEPMSHTETLKNKLEKLYDDPDEFLKVAREIGYDNLTSEQMNYVTAIEEAYEFRADPIKGTLEDGKHVLESMKGFVVGGYEFAKDTIQGTIETGKALIGHADDFIKNPKATVNSVLEYDYKAAFESMLQSIADSWDEKMVHGDSYSRGHYIAYAIGTIWGLAEAGPTVVSGSKSLGKAGKAAAQTAKKSVNSVKQHFSPPKNRYTPALEGMLQRAGEAPNVKNTPLLKELLEDKKKSVLFKSIDKNGDFVGSLKGEQIHLKNVKVKEISYTKRDPAETKKLRSTFNGSVKKKFLKSLVNDPQKLKQLKNAGLSDSDIARMQDGLNPKGWQVHHKLPLDDGGTNSMDNLILMKNDPFHKAITNEQNALTRGLTPGQTKKIKNWPIPSGEIYPIEK